TASAAAPQGTTAPTGLAGQIDALAATEAAKRRLAEQHANENLQKISPYYDPRHPLTVTGVVTDLQWTDPRVVVFVSESDGTFWGLTMSSVAEMERAGFDQNSLKIGEKLRVSGYAAKGTGAPCPAPLPNACAMLSNGARHAFAIGLTRLDANASIE